MDNSGGATRHDMHTLENINEHDGNRQLEGDRLPRERYRGREPSGYQSAQSREKCRWKEEVTSQSVKIKRRREKFIQTIA